MTSQKKIITLELTELDVTILLEALGARINDKLSQRLPTKSIEILIERIYRKLGVRLD